MHVDVRTFRLAIRRHEATGPTGPRRDPSPALRRHVLEFYGEDCVLCDTRAALELHHVNERHDDTVFANLVPLCSTANQAFREACYLRRPGLVDEVEPSQIDATAVSHFQRGRPAAAFACNAIAAHLYQRRLHMPERALHCLVYGLTNLQPLAYPLLVVDALAHTVVVAHGMRRVPEFLAAELLSQLAILLFDWEEFEWSAAITAKAMRLYRRARPFREDTGFKEARLARAQKRDALSAAVPVGGTRRARAIAAVREARSDADHRGDRQGTMSALYVEAVLWEATGAARKSVERAEEALTFRASADAFTEANTRALLARGLHRLGEPARARQQLADSLRIANRHDIILSPAVVDGAVLRVGGREAFGMGHRPMFSVRRRGDSPFRHEMLNEFVEALGG